MENATANLKLKAKWITKSNSEDGVGGKKEVKATYYLNKEKFERFVTAIIDYKKINHLNVNNDWLNGHPFQDNNEPLDTTQWVEGIFYLNDLLS
jgi:hypothetical protein